jgi:hypothetical protein
MSSKNLRGLYAHPRGKRCSKGGDGGRRQQRTERAQNVPVEIDFTDGWTDELAVEACSKGGDGACDTYLTGSDGACFSGAEMGGFKRFGGGGGNKELSERKMYLSRVFQWYDFPSAP